MQPARLPPNVLRAILLLASATFQDRYITGASAEERVDPQNLLGDVLAVEHWIIRAPAGSSVKAPIYRFLAAAYEHMDNFDQQRGVSDPNWLAIRTAAAKALEELGHGPTLARMESGDFSAAQA